MNTITQYYNISGPVPFADVDVDDDNYLFVDPFKIRMGYGPPTFANAAVTAMSSFFNEITGAVVSGNAARRARGLDLLQHFEEPRETRLGMSKQGFDGHGGSTGIGQEIWDALDTDAALLVRVGVLHQIEEIPLFVPRVGNDITSDLTTRVIFEPLVDFTNACVSNIPLLAGGTGVKTYLRRAWDPIAARWVSLRVSLPTANGQPLLLVPQEWTSRNLLLNATRFFDTTLLSYEQMSRAVEIDGKLLKTPKDRLRADPRLRRSQETIIRVVEEAYGKGTNVVADFERWASERYTETA